MRQIADNVYQIPVMPRDSINCYWVGGILIDAGIRSSKNVILSDINRIEAATKISTHAHVLTHAHADHQGSTKAICDTLGIPLWTSEPEKGPAESGNVTVFSSLAMPA